MLPDLARAPSTRRAQTGTRSYLGVWMSAIPVVGYVADFDDSAPSDSARARLAVTRPTASAFLGVSPAAARVRASIDEAARDAELPVLVCGESGVGKELAARAIHDRGRGGPFVAINVNALAPTLFESELFGHARGAFTGAVSDRIGALEEAGDGTLLLDEIGDLAMSLSGAGNVGV